MKRKSMRLQKLLAIMMTIIMTSSQLQTIAYAKDQTQQSNAKQETISENDNHEKLRLEQKKEQKIQSNDVIIQDNQEKEIVQTEDEKKEEQKILKDQTRNSELFEELKSVVTNSKEGLERGLGTASNFGIFVNGFFHTKSDFEANFAVKKLFSLKSPKASVEKEQSKKVSYIQNFSDEYGNVLKDHPLPADYSIVAPYLVVGSQYSVDDTFNNGQSYGIDGVRLGGKEELEVIQEPVDKKLIDFNSEFSHLNNLSVYLAQLDTTETANLKSVGNHLELESKSEEADIFNLSSNDFTNGKNSTIKLNMIHENATCVLNVNLTGCNEFIWNTQAEIIGKNADILKKAGRVIWNFYITEVDDSGNTIYKPYKGKLTTMATMGGTFLAPSANVEIGADFFGSIISNDLISNISKIYNISFSGSIPLNGKKKENKNKTSDIVLVLKRSNTLKEGRKIVDAAKQFVSNIIKYSPESSIDVISYSADNKGLAFYNRTKGWANVENNYEEIMIAIEGLTKEETLHKLDSGIHTVYECFDLAKIRNDSKAKNVILFYDGVPGIYDEIANEIQISSQRVIEEFGANIFTIGDFTQLSSNSKSKSEALLQKVATEDSSNRKLFYQTAQDQSLREIFDKISYQIVGKTKVEQKKPKDIVLILENYGIGNELRKDYEWTVPTDYIVGEKYFLDKIPSYHNDYDQVLIEQENGRLYFNVRGCSFNIYIDELNRVLYNPPKKDDFVSIFDEEKKAAIKFIQNLKEVSPDSNICILSNPSKTGNSVIKLTEGFENVSKNSNEMINAINNLDKGWSYNNRGVSLKEVYNLLNEDSVELNGRDKQVILCSSLFFPEEQTDEALKYADLIKNNLNVSIRVINISECGLRRFIIYNPVSEITYSYVTNASLWIGDIFELVFIDIFRK
ncbi:collagen-binding domain-containing protein [Anaerosacchariphilus polymeriproducens]|uniref:Choice-of-anchor A family protein n=1 Tax=Anaerosacchariphilus polymeriproducens TaxID=1812858 RepID=A0A371B036_9FIRM|nr:collagen-binding domain-containing protein [Anaerosacchariphilus polymeriproducens]RDU25177.1 choice-of-anchor A family protein [Anaerosacchariphilus polymeriproducens]